MAKKFKIDESFLSDLIAKSLGPEDIRTEEHKAEMKLFDKTLLNLVSGEENEENKKLHSLLDSYLEEREKTFSKPEPARTRIVMFEKIGNSKLSFEDLIANITESMEDTVNATYGMLIALQCYEQMTKNAEDVAKNCFIDSSTPASPDVS